MPNLKFTELTTKATPILADEVVLIDSEAAGGTIDKVKKATMTSLPITSPWSRSDPNIFPLTLTDSVGIGINSPDSPLHVQSATAGVVAPIAGTILTLESGSSANYISFLRADGEDSGLIWSEPSNAVAGGIVFDSSLAPAGIDFRTGGNVIRFVMRSDGKMGIGITTPDTMLHVHRASAGAAMAAPASTVIAVENNTSCYISMLAPDDKDTAILFGNPNAAVDGGMLFNGPANLRGLDWRVNGNLIKMTLDSAGNLGVGVAPASKLDVDGSVAVKRVATAVNVNTVDEVIIGVTDTSVARTITIQTADIIDGRLFIIKDESGNAGTNNITIATEAAETIDGLATVAITADFGVARLYSDGSNLFLW